MPDPFGLEQKDDADTQIRDYLGRLAPLAFRNQPALPVTGAPAVGAPVGPVQAGTMPASVVAQAGGPEIGSLSPGLISMALSGGMKLSDIARRLFAGSPSAGATMTPSGQFTTSAPEILRPAQFPDITPSPLSGAEASAAAVAEHGPTDLGGLNLGGLSQYIGPAFGAGMSIYDIINAIRSGQPAGVVGPALSLGTTIGSQAGLLPAELTSITAGGIPFAAATAILSGVISDMIADPHGSRSAVQDFNTIMSQTVPQELGILQLAAAVGPLITENLTTDQALALYQIARAGVKDASLLADPLGRQGREKAGVEYGMYPGANEAVQAFQPQAWIATLRLQNILAQRGVDIPTLEGYVGSDVQRQSMLDQLYHAPVESTEGYTVPAGPRYGHEADFPGGFIDPVGPLGVADFGQLPPQQMTELQALLAGRPQAEWGGLAETWGIGASPTDGASPAVVAAGFGPSALSTGGGGDEFLKELEP